MKEKLTAIQAFLKRMWIKIVEFSKIAWAKAIVFSKFAWTKIVLFSKFAWAKLILFAKFVWKYLTKAYAFLAPKVVSGCKCLCNKVSGFIKSAFSDKQKLILAIILTIAILFSCIAVVRAVKGVVNGVAGIFASDKAETTADEGHEEISLPEEIEAPEEAANPAEEAVPSTGEESSADKLPESTDE